LSALLESWVNDSLETYRPELVRLLWPIFVHCVLDLAADCYTKDLELFFKKHSSRFQREHEDELRQLQVITLPEHLEASIAKIFRENKYRLTLSSMTFNVLLQYLESREIEGGSVIITIIQLHLDIKTVDRARLGPELSLASMLARNGDDFDYPAEDEGIPGHNPGSSNTDSNAPTVLPKLSLGQLPMESDMSEDVEAGLEDEDAKNPPRSGEQSLVEVFQQKIKKEPMDDAPSREQVPLPPPMARDVAMEIQKIREHRDRFKIDPRTGGVTAGISVCMYTMHNTYDS
jgi:transcription initiation factor TFIID subunit 5